MDPPQPRPSPSEPRVGFDALPEQLVHRSCHSGFCFNVLCVGEPSIGKTTLIRSLFALPGLTAAADDGKRSPSVPPGDCAVELVERRHDLEESGIKLRLRVVETRNFGNQIDKRACFRPIADYIDAQFQKALDLELHVDSYPGQTLDTVPLDRDPCVHACLYLIVPTGHSVKAIDLVTMRELGQRVNLIPVIAKADALTGAELIEMRKRVRADLGDIPLYQWPTADEAVSAQNAKMNERMPFAVVGSTDSVALETGAAVRGRAYSWGVVQVENEHHCDFVQLRETLIRTNMLDLVDRTHAVQYEAFRQKRLRDQLGGGGGGGGGDVIERLMRAYSDRRATIRAQMATEEEALKKEFIDKVRGKEAELKDTERRILDDLVAVKQRYREQKDAIEQQWTALNAEIGARKVAAGGTLASATKNIAAGSSGGGGPFSRRRKQP